MPPTAPQPEPAHRLWRSAPDRRRQLLALAALLTVVVAVYLASYRFGFVYDDYTRIYSNPWLTEPGGWRHMLTAHSFAFDPAEAPKYYRPVVMLWFLLNHRLFGLAPAGWHLTTVAVHLLATALVFFTTRKLTADFRAALFTAALWSLHPTRVESVAWISGVDDPLVLVLLLTSFLLFLSARATTATRILSLAFFALALLTKETAVIFPFALFVYGWALADATFKPRVKSAARNASLYLALLVPYFGLRWVVLKTLVAAQPTQPWLATLFTAPVLLADYLRLWFWPAGLSAFYNVDPVASLDLRAVTAIIVIALVAFLISRWYRQTREPLILFASAWFLLFLAPGLSIRLLNEGDLLHDRYLYESSLGLALWPALAILDLAHKLPSLRKILAVASVALVTVLAALSVRQSFYWTSNASLYHRAMAVAPRNEMPYINLGIVYANRGMWKDAAEVYRQLDAVHPGSHRVLITLAAMEFNGGDLAASAEDTARAIRANGTFASDQQQLGMMQRKLGDLETSERTLRTALAMYGHSPGMRRELAITLIQSGKPSEARELLRQELQMNPNDPEAISAMQQIKAKGKAGR